MKLARAFGLLIAAGLAGSMAATSASAQTLGAYGCGGFAQPGWMGYAHSPYAMGQIPVPPYFALHPPVYYSAPVPRSYGYSPYAYPGTMETPAIVMPEIIENPHVEKMPAPAQETNMKVVRAQVINNPFVRAELQASSQVAARN
ncbi:MAG: hypothetical protein KDB23_03180 [Planctomycetales bacterium]|nr:hypothetical protein [Planctomycetales bacterium]